MFDAAFKALAQMITPPFRSVLLKSVGLALALLVVVVITLGRLIAWLTHAGEHWAEGALGTIAHAPLQLAGWLLAFALGSSVVAGAIVLMPAVTAVVASFFTDEIAEKVEQSHYPLDPPGVIVPLPRAILEGLKAAGLAILLYIVCAPFVIFAGFGALLLFLANAWLLGRVYFDLAAMRFHPVMEAKRLRRLHGGTVFLAGLFIAGFVTIPIVNLATPLFGTAFMVHMHKRLTRTRQAELLEPARGGPR
jgi:CysZ protein